MRGDLAPDPSASSIRPDADESVAVVRPVAAPRPTWRAVAVPNEHGGWGLTAEPALLGLMIAPSIAGLALGLSAMLAFIARAPLRVVLVDDYRGRRLERTRLARRVLAVEVAIIAALVAAALATASDRSFWWPALIAAPLVVVELAYDMRSRSRRLVPELAGAIGICSVVTMIVIADSGPVAVAIGAWLVLGSRAVSSIPHVRGLIARLHHRHASSTTLLLADLVALAGAVAAVAVDIRLAAGSVAVAVIVIVQRWLARRPPIPPKVTGILQTVIGLTLVVVTAIGVHLI